MVLKILNRAFFVALTITMSITSSCEKEFLVYVNCAQCLPDEPESTSIRVKVLIDSSVTSYPVVYVYEGTGTEGRLVYTYQPWQEITTTIEVAINRTYTLEAVYFVDGKPVKCIDSVRPSVKYTKSDCDEPCYFVYNNKVNLKLKYF